MGSMFNIIVAVMLLFIIVDTDDGYICLLATIVLNLLAWG